MGNIWWQKSDKQFQCSIFNCLLFVYDWLLSYLFYEFPHSLWVLRKQWPYFSILWKTSLICLLVIRPRNVTLLTTFWCSATSSRTCWYVLLTVHSVCFFFPSFLKKNISCFQLLHYLFVNCLNFTSVQPAILILCSTVILFSKLLGKSYFLLSFSCGTKLLLPFIFMIWIHSCIMPSAVNGLQS